MSHDLLIASKITAVDAELWDYGAKRDASHYDIAEACMIAAQHIRNGVSGSRSYELGKKEIDRRSKWPANVVPISRMRRAQA